MKQWTEHNEINFTARKATLTFERAMLLCVICYNSTDKYQQKEAAKSPRGAAACGRSHFL